jgi:hypothetical protein
MSSKTCAYHFFKKKTKQKIKFRERKSKGYSRLDGLQNYNYSKKFKIKLENNNK